jgi:hypothetical protein
MLKQVKIVDPVTFFSARVIHFALFINLIIPKSSVGLHPQLFEIINIFLFSMFSFSNPSHFYL